MSVEEIRGALGWVIEHSRDECWHELSGAVAGLVAAVQAVHDSL